MRVEQKVWDRFSGVYDMFMKKDTFAYSIIASKILDSIKREDNILEICTGTGEMALKLSSKADNIKAVDFSAGMIKKAEKKAKREGINSVEFQIQDACDLKYEDNFFDVVVICNSLHIIPEIDKVISEIHRVLKPSGMLIAPNFVHRKKLKAVVFSKIMFWTGFRDYHKWTEKSYHEYLINSGFIIRESILIKASFDISYVEAVYDYRDL